MTISNKLGSTIQVLEVMDPEFSTLGCDLPAITVGESGKCAHCGKAITWQVLCQNERGEVFVMGRTCALEDESVHKLSLRSKEEKAQSRADIALIKSPAFITWAAGKPHPKGWANKTLLDDVHYWAAKGPAYVKATLVAFRKATSGAEVKLSKKDQQRLDFVKDAATRAQEILPAYEEACATKVRVIAKRKADAERTDLPADVLILVTDSYLDEKNSAVRLNTSSIYGDIKDAIKLRKVLLTNGVEVPELPSFESIVTEGQAIAAKHGVKFGY